MRILDSKLTAVVLALGVVHCSHGQDVQGISGTGGFDTFGSGGSSSGGSNNGSSGSTNVGSGGFVVAPSTGGALGSGGTFGSGGEDTSSGGLDAGAGATGDGPDSGSGGTDGGNAIGVGSGGTAAGGSGAGNGGAGGTGGGGAGGTGGGAGGTSSGGAGTGGTGGTGSGGAGGGGSTLNCNFDTVGNVNRNPNFCDLSPKMLAAFDPDTADTVPISTPPSPAPTGWITGMTTAPTPPAGWNWHTISGATCRDGSPTGFYTHDGTASSLLIYLEGGGACSDDHFCAFNPQSVNTVLSGDGESVIGSTFGAGAGWQQPGVYTDNTGVQGIFDTTNAANPYKDWNMIYVPYCTGDVFYGRKPNGTVAAGTGQTPPQQFVGGTNMDLFIGHIVPTYKNKVSRVVLTGASAGGFGAALNASMVMDAFGDNGGIRVDIMDDSGPPFEDNEMPICMQQKWRAQWGLQFPPDCTECQQADGGGMVHLSDFLLRKHPRGNIGIISSMNDEVIRLFYSVGLNSCQNYDIADPVCITLGQIIPCNPAQAYYPADEYATGLTNLRSSYVSTGRLSTYFLGGANISKHQHEFRARFYDTTVQTSGETIAQFSQDFLNGTLEQVGP